jgi:putative glycosyltransferase
MQLSIVSTLYQSAPHLEEFYTRISAAASAITDDYEVILVNDGSPDESLELAVSLYEKDDKVRVIDLSRNFGHHKSMMTGLAHARGALVFLIDCDLEEDPELLNEFHQHIISSHADVVFGFQPKRKGNAFERITGTMFYKLLNVLSSYPVPENLLTVRLMTQRYVASLIQHLDRELWGAGLWAITGFKQVPHAVSKHDKGSSTYTLRRKISELVSAITASSSKPLVFIFYLGCAIIVLSSIAALALIIRRIFFGALLAGWASLIVSVWLLGGLILFCLGIIGIYLSKIFMETKRRPYTIIRQVYERPGESAYELQQHSGKRGAVLYGESHDVWPHR